MKGVLARASLALGERLVPVFQPVWEHYGALLRHFRARLRAGQRIPGLAGAVARETGRRLLVLQVCEWERGRGGERAWGREGGRGKEKGGGGEGEKGEGGGERPNVTDPRTRRQE